MSFDPKTILASGGSLGNIATSFGVPSCMLGLASDVLGLLPTDILFAMRNAMAAGQELADGVIKKINTTIRDELGISLFPDRDGFFGFFSDTSRFGMDVFGGITGALGGFIGFAQGLAQAGNELYAKYQEAAACLQEFKDFLDNSSGGAAERKEEFAKLDPQAFDTYITNNFSVYIDQAGAAEAARQEFTDQMETIDNILSARRADPTLDPSFELAEITESVFRLEFGPPKSLNGTFVLSVDGLYFDSQVSGLQPALLELEQRQEDNEFSDRGKFNGDLWKMEFDPSLGGRGIPATSKELKYYFNSILDPNILDNSPGLTDYYNKDELLLSIQGQKDRRIFDLSSELQSLIDAASSEAIIENTRQVLLSESSYFEDKINKRKKQIEMAVKVPVILNKGSLFAPGEVPVNDFSYLAGSNFLLDIENQRKITLNQADVTGVVLPLEVKYADKIETNETVFIDHILLANVAKGETISSPDEPSGIHLQINTRIVEDELFALYNYLNIQVDDPSGTLFETYNSSRLGTTLNSQTVGIASSVLRDGVGIPFLSGVAFPEDGSSDIDFMGSYIRLPAASNFQDLLYNSNGATFEAWIHTPELDDSSTGYNLHSDATLGLYRLILANENVGISTSRDTSQSDINNMDADLGTGIVRGAILGFTRDRRFTQNDTPSNTDGDNPVSQSVLVLAPTQSFDSSSAGFIARRGTNCDRDSYYGMTVPIFDTFNGKSLSSCANELSQLSVSIDPKKDEVRVYLDGVKLATSSYQSTFPTTRKGETYKAPSVKQNNSFEYDDGPSLDEYFTPWIIGGGYTDGYSKGNFMGGEYGGKVSGLRGHIGCTRFYSKPLSDAEVLNNYKATERFFKNVEVSNPLV